VDLARANLAAVSIIGRSGAEGESVEVG
jgi:hypothetical protein